MGLRTTNKCTFCDEVDYIEHFFWFCQKVKPVWRVCFDYIYRLTGKWLAFSETDVLFGYQPEQMRKFEIQVINHLILIAKMVISKFKYGIVTDICLLFEKEFEIRYW